MSNTEIKVNNKVNIEANKDFCQYQKAAESGHIEAQNNLGYCYQNGIGVEKNEVKAFEWYEKSAKQGDSNAQYW